MCCNKGVVALGTAAADAGACLVDTVDSGAGVAFGCCVEGAFSVRVAVSGTVMGATVTWVTVVSPSTE